MTALDRGLGLYPGDACFDESRPSMLPYWIDDFSESTCFYNSNSVMGAVLPAAGYMAGQTVGGITQGLAQAISSSSGPWLILGVGLAVGAWMLSRK